MSVMASEITDTLIVCSQVCAGLLHRKHQTDVADVSFLWCHNGHDGVSNHQPHDYLLNRLLRRRSKKTSKLRVTGLCVGNSPGTGEFPAQMASNAKNVSIWWRHHVVRVLREWSVDYPHKGPIMLRAFSWHDDAWSWQQSGYIDCISLSKRQLLEWRSSLTKIMLMNNACWSLPFLIARSILDVMF